MKKQQKFLRGDLVHISKDLGSSMEHFSNDRDAVIMGSYKDQFGGNNVDDYSIMFADTGSTCSWYHEQQLTFKEHIGERGIKKIEAERERREDEEKDLDYIIKNWKGFIFDKSIPGASMTTLFGLMGITNPWGSNGEGINYALNSQKVIILLSPLLSKCCEEGKTKEDFLSLLNKLMEPSPS